MMLTIFTPTYNRAGFLKRIYESLRRQKNKDFEWLVVDDGSTDMTESVMEEILASSDLTIRYIKKENGGKHTAHNIAVDAAKGEYFLCLDSDDYLADDAVALIQKAKDRVGCKDYGLIAYKSDQNGNLLSNRFPACGTEKKGLYGYSSEGVRGEFALIFKTSLLRKYPFPIINGESFMGENVLFDQLEQDGYTLSVLPEVIEICEYQSDGLTSDPYRLLLHNPTGCQLYYMQRIDMARTLRERFGYCVRYQAFRHMSGNREWLYQGKHGFLTRLAWLPGMAASGYYRSKRKTFS